MAERLRGNVAARGVDKPKRGRKPKDKKNLPVSDPMQHFDA